ncbi:MAG: BrnT family toxin [Gammaproteobacteria bacterium]|nr:BrnT family toxin [Gammaproteobacteria bacterium]
MKLLAGVVGFQWDQGNVEKNHLKHDVISPECEEIFFNDPLLLFEDSQHSQHELRYYVLGKTNNNRLLFVVFTVRNKLIRVISARDMRKKERSIYEAETKKNTSI